MQCAAMRTPDLLHLPHPIAALYRAVEKGREILAVQIGRGNHAEPRCFKLIAERHARHLAGRAQTLQDARKPMHTDPSTI
jgi:hypothetical protein